MPQTEGRVRMILRWVLAIFYLLAGYMHLAKPAGFLAITPHWVPAPELVVALTGVAELAGGIGLLTPRTLLSWARPTAGVGLALYALCVWPANINHAMNDIAVGGKHLSWWYHGPRLAFQPVFIGLALWVGGVWPWRGSRARE